MQKKSDNKTGEEIVSKKKWISVLSVIGSIAMGILFIYLGFAWYFHSHFLPRTKLNGLSVSGNSPEAVKEKITEEIDGYTITLEERNGETEKLAGTDISLKPEFSDSIEKLIEQQNEFSWVLSLFIARELDENTMVVFDEKQMEKAMRGLICMEKKNQVLPMDAYCSEYKEDGYEIIPEEKGSFIDETKFLNELKDAVSNLEEKISLEKQECYVNPKVTADSKELIEMVETLNGYTGTVITYQVGEKSEVLDGSTIKDWMVTEDYKVSVDEAAVEDYVTDLASSYNTAFHKRELKTSYGTTIPIVGGDYGWKVDKAGEKEQILKDLEAGLAVERELVYARRAASFGEHDYGDTYVEINLTAQHLFFYKDGSLLVEADFVSGNTSKNYDTPVGAYGLTYKERDAVLRGENYASPVTYWMPYCNNVGMHDASWRSSFGGNIYKTSGSHGCVNLPPAAAKKIFENINDNDPVLVYTLPGTQSASAIASDAADVVNRINGFGEVTLVSEPAVVMARKLYDLLPDSGKSQVANYDMLLAAEAQIGALKAQVGQAP